MSGAGVTINPIAFLVVQPDGVKMISINHSSSLDKLLDYVPDLMDKVNNIINRNEDKKEKYESTIPKEETEYEYEYDETIEDE